MSGARYYKFFGTCVDGPKRGESYGSQYRYFRCVERPMEISTCYVGSLEPQAPTYYLEREYRWSDSLSQWCMVY